MGTAPGPRLAERVREHIGQPVFVTGGPPRTPFPGPGVAHWSNVDFVRHHARSWDSAFALSAIMPLELAAHPERPAFERFLTRQRAALSLLAEESPPLVAQVWGPMTLASTRLGLEEFLSLLHSGADVSSAMAEGLTASRTAAVAAIEAGAPVLWIAEPLPVLIDPDTLARTWVAPMRSLIALARAADTDPVVHMSGAASHVLPFIDTVGAAGVSITAGTPLSAARNALDEATVVFGNLDSMRLLDKDAEWLSQQAQSMVAEMAERLFVVTPGSALPDRMDVEPLAAFVDAARV